MTVLILALLILGPGLLIAEAHLPTYGALGTAGIAALVAGVVLAVLQSGAGVAVALGFALPIGLAALVLAGVGMRKALAAGHQRSKCGPEGLIGQVGVVRRPLDPLGHVVVDGALWRARRSWTEADEPPPAEGEAVVVDHVQGVTLSVRRAEVWEVEP